MVREVDFFFLDLLIVMMDLLSFVALRDDEKDLNLRICI